MQDKKYRQFWWQITLTKILFSIIPLFILAATLYYHFSVSYTDKVMERLRTLAGNRQASLDLFLDERISQLITLAYTSSHTELQDPEYLSKALQVMQSRSRSYIDLGVIDQKGDHLNYVGPYKGVLKGVNYRHEPWFDAVLNSGVYVSDVFLGFRKVPHFIIAVLVREKDQILILRATIDSDVIDNIVHAAWAGKSGDAYLINRENLLQTKPRFGGNLLEPPPGPDFSSVVGTRVEEITYKGNTSLYAATQIKGKKWVLVIMEDPKEPLAPVLSAKYLVAFLLLLGLGLIILGSVLTTRTVLNRLIKSDVEKAKSDELVLHESKMAALGKMAAGVAHEINNPLAVIAEEAGWMKDLLKEEDVAHSQNFQEYQETIKKIEYHVERVKKVTHRLLGFARRMEPTEEKVMVNQILEECIGFLENEARYRNISVTREMAPDLPTIASDSSQLQQVFLNILNNAEAAVSEGGHIDIRVRADGDRRVAVSISDDGVGIPKENLDRIFEPFFTTREGSGTGLGLSITYGIVQRLGGEIGVSSELGKGTCFTVLLPVRRV